MATEVASPEPITAPRFGVVVKEVAGEEGPTFKAMAYTLNQAGIRQPISNGDGYPLVAFGKSPVKATSYLLSALRRKSLIDRTADVPVPELVLRG